MRISPAKAQRRKEKPQRGYLETGTLCAFAPLRERNPFSTLRYSYLWLTIDTESPEQSTQRGRLNFVWPSAKIQQSRMPVMTWQSA
jgi:hypothetical protein